MTTARLTRAQFFQSQATGTATNVLRRPAVATDFSAGANFDIFNVSGVIEIIYMFGVVTFLFDVGIAVPSLTHTPTVGTGGVALSGAHVGLNAAPAGEILTWDGLTGGLLTSSGALGVSDIDATSGWLGNVINIPAGIISVTNATPDTDGTVDWYIAYIPLLPATVVTVL